MSLRKHSIIKRLQWLGALLVLMTLGGTTALYLTLRHSGALLGDVIYVAEPLQEGALEIEINTIGVTLSVIQYLDRPNPALRRKFDENAERILLFTQRLRQLPLDQAGKGTLREIDRRFAELRRLGTEMMARQDKMVELQQSVATASTNDLPSSAERNDAEWSQPSDPAVSSSAAALTRLHADQARDRHNLFQQHEKLNDLLDRGIQILAAEGVNNASQSADLMVNRGALLAGVLVMLLGLTCLIATVGIVKRLIRPLSEMVVGANAFAQGDFFHRIEYQGEDEIGNVISTLNEMADKLSENHSSLEHSVNTRTAELDDAKRVLETTLASIDDAVVAIDSEGQLQFMNRAAERLVGRTEAEARGHLWQEIIPLVDQATGDFVVHLLATPSPGDVHGVYRNWCVRTEDGDLLDVDVSVGNMTDSTGKILGSVLVMRNAEQARQLQRQLAHQVDHDTLTELPNRVMFGRELDRCLARASRQGQEIAVLFIDLDGFKEVNDVHGHSVGDEILVLVSQRLRAVMRPMDLIARLSGDEFCLAVAYPKGAFPYELANRILHSLSSPYQVNTLLLNLSASMGISRYPQDGLERTALMRYADAAMYEAKNAGKNQYAFHNRKIRERAEARAATIEGLRHALKHGEFELYYQPQVALADGALKGVEALLRWRRDGELVMPGEFLHIADEAGLMPDIDEWVVVNACAQLRKWEDAGLQFRMAMNATGDGLSRNLVKSLEEALKRYSLRPETIEIEITESRFLEDEPVLAAVRRLRELGVRVAIDDFGTGYSSFGALRELPVDSLKIDRSFVQAIAIQPKHAAIVGAIIGTAHVIGLDVIAEGIEEPAQANLLMSLGCRTGQGYYFSCPVPASEIPALIDRLGLYSTDKVALPLPRSA